MTTIADLTAFDEKMTRLVEAVQRQTMAEKPSKTAPKHYSMKDTARLIGRSYRTVRDAEVSGLLPNPVTKGKVRAHGYTLAQINHARDRFGTRLRRADSDPPMILAFSNFKGGAAKTTTAVHCAQYLAEQGLRVLLVDVDPQASATAMHGYIPDHDIDPESTIQPYMDGEMEGLADVIRSTAWDGLDLIPSNLDVYNSEYILASNPSQDALQRLKRGLDAVATSYDCVLIDPPPALGSISLSVAYAATALVVPSPPAITDLFSTKAFAAMMLETAKSLDRHGYIPNYHFVRLLLTKVDESSETQAALVDVLPDVLGTSVMTHSVVKTAALDRSMSRGRTVYEVTSKQVSSKVLQRGVRSFNRVNEEILGLIRRTWPSHEAALRQQ